MWAYTSEEIEYLSPASHPGGAMPIESAPASGRHGSSRGTAGIGHSKQRAAVIACWADKFAGMNAAVTGWEMAHRADNNMHVLGPLVLGALRRWRSWLDRQAALAELNRLDDRVLNDLDLTRSDFPAVLDGTFRRKPWTSSMPPSETDCPMIAQRPAFTAVSSHFRPSVQQWRAQLFSVLPQRLDHFIAKLNLVLLVVALALGYLDLAVYLALKAAALHVDWIAMLQASVL